MIRIKSLFPSLALLAVSQLFSQENRDTIAAPTTAPITIQTNIEGARVYVGSDSVGVTPGTFHLALGAHRIKIVSPNVESWLSDPIVDSLVVTPDTSRTIHYAFSQKFLILSSPSGAEVVSQDSVIGTTPLVVKSRQPLRLRLEGYEEIPLDFANVERGILSTQLKKTWQSVASDSITAHSEEKSSPLKLYLSGAATIIAGATSAYFKVKADNAYSNYVRVGDPSQLSEVNTLDTAAGIALAATQISLGIFTYFILTE